MDLQSKITELLTKKNSEAQSLQSSSDAQLVELENKLMMVEEDKAQAIEQIQNERLEVDKLKKEVVSLQSDMKKKVNELTQVANMKKMIQQKNTQVKELRDRLSKYEKDDDDD